MEKRQYTFLVLLLVLLYLCYRVLNHEYNDYLKDKFMESREKTIQEIKKDLEYANSLIDYKKSKTYKNKVLKEQQWLKMKWEEVIIFTLEDKYKKYLTKEPIKTELEIIENKEDNVLDSMTNYEKWIYLIFKKDLTK